MSFKIGAFHAGQAASHVKIAKCHAELGKLHALIAESETHKSAQGIRDDCHASISEYHKELSGHHADLADQHIKAAKAAGVDTNDDSRGTDVLHAATGSEPFGMFACRDFSKAEPTRVHGVMPQDMPSSVRLVARPGGPQVDSDEDATSLIDSFAHSGEDIRKSIIGQ